MMSPTLWRLGKCAFWLEKKVTRANELIISYGGFPAMSLRVSSSICIVARWLSESSTTFMFSIQTSFLQYGVGISVITA